MRGWLHTGSPHTSQRAARWGDLSKFNVHQHLCSCLPYKHTAFSYFLKKQVLTGVPSCPPLLGSHFLCINLCSHLGRKGRCLIRLQQLRLPGLLPPSPKDQTPCHFQKEKKGLALPPPSIIETFFPFSMGNSECGL